MAHLSDDILTTVHSVLYVLHKLGGKAGFLKIFKVLYFADQKHLAKYGSPVISDQYIAMQNGPVPSIAYDIMKALRGDGLMRSWHDEFSPYFHVVGNYTVYSLIEPDLDYLSESEIEALDESVHENKSLTYDRLSKKSHDEAWQKADKNGDIQLIDIAKAGKATPEMISYIKNHFENKSAKCL